MADIDVPHGGSFVQITIANVLEVSEAIIARGLFAGVRARAITQHYGQLVLTQAMANASGRPGPNAPQGDFRRSLGLIMTEDGLGFIVAHVGTNLPQGRRLEFGFVGEDSLGRFYNQKPYPYLGPALDKYEDQFMAAILESA